MPKLIPWNLDGFMPSSPEELNQAASKYLHIVGLELPRITSKILLVPEQAWDHCGHVLGPSAAHLNFQDNSVLFIGTASWISGPVLPPFGSIISLPASPDRVYSVDDKAIEFLLEGVGGSGQDGDAISNAIGPYLSMPLVAEAAIVRRRSIPLCTPMLIPCGWPDMSTMASLLAELVRGMGVSIIISSEMLAVLPDENPLSVMVPESISSLVPQFAEEVRKETKRDATSGILFQSLARETNGEAFKLWDGRTVYEDRVVKSYSLSVKHAGFSKEASFSKLTPLIWRAVSDALCGREESGQKLPEIPSMLELRMENHSVFGGKAGNVGLDVSLRSAAREIIETLSGFGMTLADIPADAYLRVILLDNFRTVPSGRSGLEKRLAAGDVGVLLRSEEGEQKCIMPWEIRRYGDRASWYVEETESQLIAEGGSDISLWTFKAKDRPARLSWVLNADWE